MARSVMTLTGNPGPLQSKVGGLSAEDEVSVTIKSHASDQERRLRGEFAALFRDSPIPTEELLQNLPLFISRQQLSQMLYLRDLYEKIVNVHGVVMEFGVRWGKNLAMFSALRGIYEPFNHNRRIIGFDSFAGFPSTTEQDGKDASIKAGSYAVTDGYEDHLKRILNYHEQESPIPHIRKYELVKGDATTTIHSYLRENPQTIIALAYFDFDLYEPTKICLEAIKPYLTKGSVLAFDELNHPTFPGETIAVREILGLSTYAIQRSPLDPNRAYLVIE